jgi:hypothetical protein
MSKNISRLERLKSRVATNNVHLDNPVDDDEDVELSEELQNKSGNHTHEVSATVGVSGTVTVLEDLIRLFGAGDDWRSLHETCEEAHKVAAYQKERSQIQAKKTAVAKKKQDELISKANEVNEKAEESRKLFEDCEGSHIFLIKNLSAADNELKDIRQKIDALSLVLKKETDLLSQMKATANVDAAQLKKLYMLYHKISNLEWTESTAPGNASQHNDVYRGCKGF